MSRPESIIFSQAGTKLRVIERGNKFRIADYKSFDRKVELLIM